MQIKIKWLGKLEEKNHNDNMSSGIIPFLSDSLGLWDLSSSLALNHHVGKAYHCSSSRKSWLRQHQEAIFTKLVKKKKVFLKPHPALASIQRRSYPYPAAEGTANWCHPLEKQCNNTQEKKSQDYYVLKICNFYWNSSQRKGLRDAKPQLLKYSQLHCCQWRKIGHNLYVY